MKFLILIALALTLSANECNIAKNNYDKSYKLYRQGIQEECTNLVKSIDIIIKKCEYSNRTKRIAEMMRDFQKEECRNIGE